MGLFTYVASPKLLNHKSQSINTSITKENELKTTFGTASGEDNLQENHSTFIGKITIGIPNLKNRFWIEKIVWLCKSLER
jgi:hypothetical protein